MADFCTKCSEDLFPPEIKPDIDVLYYWNQLNVGEQFAPFLCEGCTLTAILKPEENVIRIFFMDGKYEDFTLQQFISLSGQQWAAIKKLHLNG